VSLWTLGTQAWVIQDGNYEDFALGQRYSSAVTAFPHPVEGSSSAGAPQTRPLEDGRYAFSCAILKFAGYGAWVIDFGIHCYGKAALPEGAQVGDVLAGEVRFFLPYPAVYQEGFDSAASHSTYSWQVERIRVETTPWLVGEDGVHRRDSNKIGYVDVESTNAETDEGGSADYLFDCKLLDDGKSEHRKP
jgi:hypothetical protein